MATVQKHAYDGDDDDDDDTREAHYNLQYSVLFNGLDDWSHRHPISWDLVQLLAITDRLTRHFAAHTTRMVWMATERTCMLVLFFARRQS